MDNNMMYLETLEHSSQCSDHQFCNIEYCGEIKMFARGIYNDDESCLVHDDICNILREHVVKCNKLDCKIDHCQELRIRIESKNITNTPNYKKPLKRKRDSLIEEFNDIMSTRDQISKKIKGYDNPSDITSIERRNICMSIIKIYQRKKINNFKCNEFEKICLNVKRILYYNNRIIKRQIFPCGCSKCF